MKDRRCEVCAKRKETWARVSYLALCVFYAGLIVVNFGMWLTTDFSWSSILFVINAGALLALANHSLDGF